MSLYYYSNYFSDVKNRTKLRYLSAVRRVPKVVMLIFKTDQPPESYEQICIEAIKRDPDVLGLIEPHLQTNNMCLTAVKQRGTTIRFVHQPTSEMYLEAVKQNGLALRYIKWTQQSFDMCFIAVKQNGRAIKYVNPVYKSYQLCLAAVSQNGYALCYIDTNEERIYTEAICIQAVKQNGDTLQFVRHQTPNICLAAVKQKGASVKHVKIDTSVTDMNIYFNICLEAVKQSPCAIRYIGRYFQTPEICYEAIRQMPYFTQYVKIDMELVKNFGNSYLVSQELNESDNEEIDYDKITVAI